MGILDNKHYNEESVFKPENLLREAKRQKALPDCHVPSVCLLDPDGDILDYLQRKKMARKTNCWACYHSKLFTFHWDDFELGILPCIVGAPYAVLVAEQLFVSGCRFLISITSAGIITRPQNHKRFSLIKSAIRDEGTSYHYLPPEKQAILNQELFKLFHKKEIAEDCPYFTGTSWTTDAPFRETVFAIEDMKRNDVMCVEMEAAALYSLSESKKYNIVCFAHLTNSMAQNEGDFEKGEEFGSIESLNLVSYVLKTLESNRIISR